MMLQFIWAISSNNWLDSQVKRIIYIKHRLKLHLLSVRFMSSYKLCLERGHRTPAFGDGDPSFPWATWGSFRVNQRETEPPDAAVTVELGRSQAGLCPLPWALDLDHTAHMGKGMGWECWQTQLPGNVSETTEKHPGRNLILHSKCAHSFFEAALHT